MMFGSVCSGIEAASVAWNCLGWKAAWFAEIEPFPCAVLAHHYPDVPNLGDMSKLPGRVLSGEIEAPDVFCGGTPCQAFSVAGLRRSLDDARGNLSLVFCEIADAIDTVRLSAGDEPSIIFWENVPGVLSTSDNAFGCFLAGLAGEDDPLEPPGGKWTNAGYVLGPQRAVAWRVTDAQYFGVAQRRRRVFVVASAREGFDPAAVLFEFEGVRRDSAPSREAGEGFAAGTLRSTDGGSDVDHARAGHLPITMAHGQGGAEIGFDRGPTLTCNHEAPIAAYAAPVAFDTYNQTVTGDTTQTLCSRGDSPGGNAHLVPAVCVTGQVTHTLKAEGFDASEDGTGRGQPIVTTYAADDYKDGTFEECDTARPLTTTADRTRGAPIVAFSCKDHGGDAGPISPTLRSMGHDGSHANAGGQVAVAFFQGEQHASAQETHPGTLLRTLRQEVGEEAFAKWGLGILDSLQQAEVLRQALHGLSIRPASFSRSWVVYCALSRSENRSRWLLQSLREAGCERCASQGWEPSEQLAGELGAYLSELSRPGAQAARFLHDLWQASQGLRVLRQALSAVQEVGRSVGGEGKPACGGMQVRRLTVEECEFLQGFPRGYSKIPWRKKPASECPDGPRYKALGNSWAVPNVRWIGERIQKEIRK